MVLSTGPRPWIFSRRFLACPCLAANEGFIGFNFSRQLAFAFVLHRQPDTVEHEPSCFLGNAESPVDFVGADTVLAVGYHPDRGQPFVEANGRILEDGPYLHRELRFGVSSLALPDTPGSDEANLTRAASWTHDAIGPPSSDQVVQAVVRVGEVEDRFLKGQWFLFHNSIIHNGGR